MFNIGLAILLSILLHCPNIAAQNLTRDYNVLGVVDGWAICVPPKNTCTQDVRCRLNDTILENTPIPSWFGPQHQDLVERTLQDTRDSIQNSSTRIATFGLGQVCFDPTYMQGQMDWWRYGWSASDTLQCFTGYASAGYHPFGTKPGYWLTQIMGLTNPLTGWNDGITKHSLVDGFYVNITKISDITPIEKYFDTVSTLSEWELRSQQFLKPATPYGDPAESRNRTDQDLIANGFDYKCCSKYNTTGPKTVETWNTGIFCQNYSLAHQQCSRAITGLDRVSLNGTWNWDHRFQEFPYPDCPGVVRPVVSTSDAVKDNSRVLLRMALPIMGMFWLHVL